MYLQNVLLNAMLRRMILKQKISNPLALVGDLLNSGRHEEAAEMLYKMAVISAKKKSFSQAASFRDRLYEIDNFDLKRIASINKTIETEKKASPVLNYHVLWSRFFDILSPKEAKALFSSLKKKVFANNVIILEQGQPNDKLFFVFQGELKIIYRDQENEFLIQKLKSGDTFGEDTFFSVNICTASVKTLTQVDVGYISRSDFEKMIFTFRALASKLKKICGSGKSIFNCLRNQGMDRRAFKRINLNTKVSFQLLSVDSADAVQRSVSAELWDISQGGLSFYFQSKNPDAVRSLIGRPIGVRFSLMVDGKLKPVAFTGIVNGVMSHPLDEYSVHLKFNRQLSENAIKTIAQVASTI